MTFLVLSTCLELKLDSLHLHRNSRPVEEGSTTIEKPPTYLLQANCSFTYKVLPSYKNFTTGLVQL